MPYSSIIASSATVRGNVRGEGSLQILGRVEGEVAVSGDLELGPDASVVGSVSGARVVVAGSINGDVRGTDAIVVEHSGSVIGDLTAPRIGMGEGAVVRGGVRTEAATTAAATRSAPVARAAERPAAAAPKPVAVAAAPPPAARRPRAEPQRAAAKPAAKKKPPPPVVRSPRSGARARKKTARR